MSPGESPDQTLDHAAGTTALYIGQGALERAGPALERWLDGRLVFVVTAQPVVDAHPLLQASIESLAGRAKRLVVPDGEAAKTLDSAQTLWTEMLDAAGNRDSRVIAIGGGSVTDVAGFVAASFLRGIELALVPTTLLSQVDAAIGGKTAIDMPGAKNAVGAFWHPRIVIADTEVLASLEGAEWRAGLAEVVKIAVSEDPELFETLERELRPDQRLTGEVLDAILSRAVAAKIDVVEADPNEGDRRRVLNLGHTLAHAIESSLGYKRIRHGEAVVYGLLFSLRLAVKRGGDRAFARRCAELLRRLEVPRLPSLDAEKLIGMIGRDKKVRRQGLHWVLPMGLGRVEISEAVEPAAVASDLESFLRDPWQL